MSTAEAFQDTVVFTLSGLCGDLRPDRDPPADHRYVSEARVRCRVHRMPYVGTEEVSCSVDATYYEILDRGPRWLQDFYRWVGTSLPGAGNPYPVETASEDRLAERIVACVAGRGDHADRDGGSP